MKCKISTISPNGVSQKLFWLKFTNILSRNSNYKLLYLLNKAIHIKNVFPQHLYTIDESAINNSLENLYQPHKTNVRIL